MRLKTDSLDKLNNWVLSLRVMFVIVVCFRSAVDLPTYSTSPHWFQECSAYSWLVPFYLLHKLDAHFVLAHRYEHLSLIWVLRETIRVPWLPGLNSKRFSGVGSAWSQSVPTRLGLESAFARWRHQEERAGLCATLFPGSSLFHPRLERTLVATGHVTPKIWEVKRMRHMGGGSKV